MIICIYTRRHKITSMFHMFQMQKLIYECLMLMLMQCKSIYARLTPRVLHIRATRALCRHAKPADVGNKLARVHVCPNVRALASPHKQTRGSQRKPKQPDIWHSPYTSKLRSLTAHIFFECITLQFFCCCIQDGYRWDKFATCTEVHRRSH